MRRKIVCSILSVFGLLVIVSQTTFGDDELLTEPSNSGIYFGGQLGMSNLNYGGSSYTSKNSHYKKRYLLAGRVFAGYAFSQFIAAEFGYVYYGYPEFKNDDGNTQNFLQHGLDLVGKANLPLNYGFSFYGKAGLALIHRGALNSNNGTFVQKGKNSRITPVGALGVSYQLAPNIAIDLSWTKTMGISDLPTTDLIGVGFTYKINL
jgi:opacity protein-like surface antigen